MRLYEFQAMRFVEIQAMQGTAKKKGLSEKKPSKFRREQNSKEMFGKQLGFKTQIALVKMFTRKKVQFVKSNV